MKICIICKSKFIPKTNTVGKYCSRKCFDIHQKTGKYLPCKVCKKKIYVHKHRLKKFKFCSFKCFGINYKGVTLSPKTSFKKGHKPWNTGKKRPEMTGEKHPLWKGNNASYHSLHHWVRRHKGKPRKCSFCGKVGTPRQIHWANKSHKYLRDLNDWIELCVPCHSKYDLNIRQQLRSRVKSSANRNI